MQRLLVQRIKSDISLKVLSHRYSTTANYPNQRKHTPEFADVVVIGIIITANLNLNQERSVFDIGLSTNGETVAVLLVHLV